MSAAARKAAPSTTPLTAQSGSQVRLRNAGGEGAGGRARGRDLLRAVLVAGYVAVIAAALVVPWGPRAFWTVLLPLLPAGIVVLGFHRWRDVCPLAFFGELGRRLHRGEHRRLPRAWQDRVFALTFATLFVGLCVRSFGANGDGVWLAGLLTAAAVLAAAVNKVFPGKTWCNFFCPVALIERIYTEPSSLAPAPSSQCARCTACKVNCPDIDQENAYWKEIEHRWRRRAYYAFPGLVLAFYVCYWLPGADWAAYFDGGWTAHPAGPDLWLGDGLFFAPGVPRLCSVPLALAAFSAASCAVFALVERSLGRWVEEPARRLHFTGALAAFAAFNLFYLFAGAPSIRRVPGLPAVVALAVTTLATLALARRWGRTRERYVNEKAAQKLLRVWSGDAPPPEDPGALIAFVKGRDPAREAHVAAYEQVVLDLLRDGLLSRDELRLLDRMRSQLGVTAKEHERLVARLSEEEQRLLDPDADSAPSIEERLQRESFRSALAEALVARAGDAELSALARTFGISPEEHRRVLAELRDAAGPLAGRARELLAAAAETGQRRAALGGVSSEPACRFLEHVLGQVERRRVGRVLDVTAVLATPTLAREARYALAGASPEARRQALDALAAACPGVDDLAEVLEASAAPTPTGSGERAAAEQVLRTLWRDPDRFVRSAALWAAARLRLDGVIDVAEALAGDPDDLVREVAAAIIAGRLSGAERKSFARLTSLEKMLFLHGVPLFERLDPEDLLELSGLTSEATVADGAPLCREGELDHDLFVLVDGSVSVSVAGPGGAEVEIAHRGPGDVVGEMAAIDERPRSATVRASGGDLKVLRIDGAAFRTRLMTRPDLAPVLLGTLADRLRDASQRKG